MQIRSALVSPTKAAKNAANGGSGACHLHTSHFPTADAKRCCLQLWHREARQLLIVVQFAVVSRGVLSIPTVNHGLAGEAWTSRLVEPPAALPAIQTGTKASDAAVSDTPEPPASAPAPRGDDVSAAAQSKAEVRPSRYQVFVHDGTMLVIGLAQASCLVRTLGA